MEEQKNNIEIVKKTYDSIAEYFAPLLDVENSSKAEVEFVDEFLSRVPQGGTIADLGCGAGKHGRYCAKKGFSVIGYDISAAMIKRAEENNHLGEMDVLLVADMCAIVSTTLFDAVIMMYSLIHLTKEQAILTLSNIRKYMKQDAKLLISVYSGDRDGYCIETLNPSMEQFFRDYSKNELQEMLEQTGFNVEEIRVWRDEDEITASNDEEDCAVIGVIAQIANN